MRNLLILTCLLPIGLFAQFDGPGGEPGSKSIHKDDGAISGWATSVDIQRGWMQISDTTIGRATAGSDSNALGAFDGAIVSLGDGGIATLSFDQAIINRDGYDFAVFENGFKVGLSYYLELAHVEVSKDGVNFVRFPSESLTDTSYQTNNFSYTSPEKVYNLAGKHQAPYGSLFDLDEVGMDTISYVRLIDVVGSVNDSFGTRDSKGRLINDPFPSPFESSGFDLDAVAVVNGNLLRTYEANLANLIVYPSLASASQGIQIEGVDMPSFEVMNLAGTVVLSGRGNSFKIETSGMYVVRVTKDQKISTVKVCVY